MKDSSNQHEKAEHDERENQSGQRSFRADGHDMRITGDLHASAGDLRQEADDIVDDEDRSEPFRPHAGEMFRVEGEHDPAQEHVDSRGDERRRAHDEYLLQGPGFDFCPVLMGPGAAVVAKGLACYLSAGVHPVRRRVSISTYICPQVPKG